MKSVIKQTAVLSLLTIAVIGCSGNNGDFGYVEGTLTIDGKPVEKAAIGFYPTQGRASIGATDSEGHYRLRYTSKQDGAWVGDHKVTISTAIIAEKGGFDPSEQMAIGQEVVEAVKGRREMLDASYQKRRTTPLTAKVVPGENPPIDFKLESKKK